MSEVLLDTRAEMENQVGALPLKTCLYTAITDTYSVSTSAERKKKRVRFAKDHQIIVVDSYKQCNLKEQPCQCVIF